MDDLCAPQWADFTSSPQRPSDSYFDIIHELHEPQIQFKTTKSKSSFTCTLGEVTEIPDVDKSTNNSPAKAAYFTPDNNKKKGFDQSANESISHEAMTKPKADGKLCKARATWSLSVNNLPANTFKTPVLLRKMKSAASENVRRSVCLPEKKESIQLNSSYSKHSVSTDFKPKDFKQVGALTKDKYESTTKLDMDDYSESVKDDAINKRLSYKIITNQRRHSNRLTIKRSSLGKSRPRVLTCQYRRQSLIKYRRRSNKFISLAEAVSKFQNGTPERFRTISNKDLKPGPLLKMKWSPLKLTHPISPALRCKQRTRHTSVLTQEEREAQQLNEMKKHQIKAKPVPVRILKAPAALKKVTKKPTTITVEFHLTQPKRTRQTIGPVPTPRQAADIKEQCKNTATSDKNPDVAVQKSTVKSVAYTLPFTFEARNKEFQMKKEKKLKELQVQETTKIKAGFHARPVPNFIKTANPVKEHSTKKSVVPCPFSFEARDKSLAKKKEEQVKQMKEENTKSRVFHANPVPSFKPVIVHGLSKENLRAKEKTVQSTTKTAVRLTKSYCDQENKQPNVNSNTTICLDTKKETKGFIRDSQPNKKEQKNIEKALNVKNEKAKTEQKKVPLKAKVPSVELNTDKRAKERCEFNEKLRRKEQEEEAKRQEELQDKLVREKMDRAELRKMAEVKARPMPVYKPMIVLKSTKMPVSPRSPAWGSKRKPKSIA